MTADLDIAHISTYDELKDHTSDLKQVEQEIVRQCLNDDRLVLVLPRWLADQTPLQPVTDSKRVFLVRIDKEQGDRGRTAKGVYLKLIEDPDVSDLIAVSQAMLFVRESGANLETDVTTFAAFVGDGGSA